MRIDDSLSAPGTPQTRRLSDTFFRCLCGGDQFVRVFSRENYTLYQCRSCGTKKGRNLLLAVEDPTKDYSTAEYFRSYLDDKNKYQQIFERLVGWIEQIQPPGRLLDVGCGVGLLLDVAVRRGWVVRGIELSTWARDYAQARGHSVDKIEALRRLQPQYDVVVCNHVLEHLEDPLATLRLLVSAVRPRGFLVVGVPNVGGLVARVVGRQWWAFRDGQEHVWWFDRRSLTRLLSQAGLTAIRSYTESSVLEWTLNPLTAVRKTVNLLADKIGQGESITIAARSGR
jgi:SAM-dependent methyltransferase